MSIGLYIHVPFCASKCAYCDFYSRVRRDQLPDYHAALKREISGWKEKGVKADTLFFGGGTPSLLTPEQIDELIVLCREVFSLEGEITMEANPDTVTPESLRGYRAAGVNRLSFGVQSAIDSELKLLGRKHTFADAERAVYAARDAGFDNLTLDLMLGIPEQTADSLQMTLERIMSLRPEHLSCYLLKIEEGTVFYKRQMGSLCADEDTTADFYLAVCDHLKKLGYRHYEISNFALPGYESRHNLKYWRCEDYLGFGPAAHSCFGGRRFYHPADLAAYISGSAPVDDGPSGSAEEKLMLALRLEEGAGPLPGYDWEALRKRCAPYLKAGLMTEKDDRLSFTEEGFLLSNSLLAEIL
ncbi:MAG: radical SAM family heme chaperone HemW [Oscillospiraceae bacterium]|nr:radical SAM family heme chaperone HemW [Oscillospiraceae bacterium]